MLLYHIHLAIFPAIAATAIVTPPAPAQSFPQPPTGAADSEAAFDGHDAGPALRLFVRAFWSSVDIVGVTFENPLTRCLYETLAAKGDAAGASRDWSTIFRRTVSPSAIVIAQRLVVQFGTSLAAMRFVIKESGPLPLEEIVDFLSDLGIALLERHLQLVRDEVIHRRLHREHMVPQAIPITAREHIILRVIISERTVGLASTSLPLRLPQSWETPAWWGALWLLLTPQLRFRYFGDIARIVFGLVLQAWTRPSMGMFMTRQAWEERFRTAEPVGPRVFENVGYHRGLGAERVTGGAADAFRGGRTSFGRANRGRGRGGGPPAGRGAGGGRGPAKGDPKGQGKGDAGGSAGGV